jgi:hypothetical protein
MKKYSISSVAVFIIIYAATIMWAAPAGHSDNLNPKDDEWILNKMINNASLNICVDTDENDLEEIIGNYTSQFKPQDYKDLKFLPNVNKDDKASLLLAIFAENLRKSLAEWTIGVAAKIRESGRSAEFENILKLLEKDYAFNIERCDKTRKYDLKVYLLTRDSLGLRYKEASGYYTHFHEVPEIYLSAYSYKLYMERTILHEMGHAMGLGDMGSIYDNTHFAYKAPVMRKSIMGNNNSANHSYDIT